MKILLIGKEGEISQSIQSKAIGRGHEFKIISALTLNYTYSNRKLEIQSKEVDFLSFDAYIIRGVKSDFAQLIGKYLYKNNKVLIDEDLGYKKIINIKNIEHKEGLNIPRFIINPQRDDIDKFTYPAIIKDIRGKKGINVYLVKNKKEAKKIIENKKYIHFMIQDYIEAQKEIRIIFIKEKVLPLGMEKINTKNVIKNIAQGGKGKAYKLNLKEIEIANECRRSTLLDIGGIDLVISKDGEYYILEVNRSPVFTEFEKCTGISVAEEIVILAENKYKTLIK